MNRGQRKTHARAWPLIALVLFAVIGGAISVKERISSVSTAAQEWAPR